MLQTKNWFSETYLSCFFIVTTSVGLIISHLETRETIRIDSKK